MGWRVEPSEGVNVSSDGTVTFPANNTDADKRYRVIYEDERGCTGETWFTVPAGNCQYCRITVSQNYDMENITYKVVDANGVEYGRYTGSVEESEAVYIDIPSNKTLYLLVEGLPEGWTSNYDEIEGHDPVQCDENIWVRLKPTIHITPHVCQMNNSNDTRPKFYFTSDSPVRDTLTLFFDGTITFGPIYGQYGGNTCHGTQLARNQTVTFDNEDTESGSKLVIGGEGPVKPTMCDNVHIVWQGGDYAFGDHNVVECGIGSSKSKYYESSSAIYVVEDRVNHGACQETPPPPPPEVPDEYKLSPDIGVEDGDAVIGWRAGSAPTQPIYIKTFATLSVYNRNPYEYDEVVKEVEVTIQPGETFGSISISPSEVGWDAIQDVESVCVESRWIGPYYVVNAQECGN